MSIAIILVWASREYIPSMYLVSTILTRLPVEIGLWSIFCLPDEQVRRISLAVCGVGGEEVSSLFYML